MADATLTERQVYILGHSLCGSEDRPYRNYYAAHARNFAEMNALVDMGYMEKGRRRPYGAYYHVTKAGAAAVHLRVPVNAGNNRPRRLWGDPDCRTAADFHLQLTDLCFDASRFVSLPDLIAALDAKARLLRAVQADHETDLAQRIARDTSASC